MNVWIKRCRKRVKCDYCPTLILSGEHMVVCKWYRGTVKDGKMQRWWFHRHYHPQCWIDQGIAAVKKIVITETRGGKKLDMPDDVREARLKIMMRRASVIQRIRREVDKTPEEQNIDRIIHLGDMLNMLKEKIEPLGGAPESWN